MKLLSRKSNSRRNIRILTIVFCFLAFAFAAPASNAQTRKGGKTSAATAQKKAAPTANKKTTAKATPDKKERDKNSRTAKKDEPKKNGKVKDKTAAKRTDKKQAEKNFKQAQSKSGKKDSAKSADKTSAKTKESERKSKETAAKQPDRRKERDKSANKTVAKVERKSVKASNRTAADEPRQTASRTPVKTNFSEIIVTAPAVVVRNQAKADAPEISRIRLGQILKVSAKNPAWYKVHFANGAKTDSGWVSAGSVNNFSTAERETIYRRIVERNYKPQGMDFGTAAEIYEFLTENFGGETTSADLELKRLLALRAALKDIAPVNSGLVAYQNFLKKHAAAVVYSEPGGEWLVRSNLFWDLHKKYKSDALAEQIAWAAAQNPLPGECEGYVNCHLFYGRMTTGEYLNLHPNGKNAPAALKALTDSLEPIVANLNSKSNAYTGPTDVTDRAEFNNLIAELRTIVSRLPSVEKEKPLRYMKVIAEGFR